MYLAGGISSSLQNPKFACLIYKDKITKDNHFFTLFANDKNELRKSIIWILKLLN
jgi:hypothetical protein